MDLEIVLLEKVVELVFVEENLEQKEVGNVNSLVKGTKKKKKNLVNQEDHSLREAIELVKEENFFLSKIKKKEVVEEDLETKVDLEDEEDSETETEITPQVNYSFIEEEFIMGLAHNVPVLDYEKLWYGEKTPTKYEPEEEYWVPSPKTENETEMLTNEEAQETFMEIQYATMLGTLSDMNMIQKRKFDLWIKFNPALFKLFELTYSVTREVNYAEV